MAEKQASSGASSPSNSISLIKIDELSSYGATKQSRLPALIKLAAEAASQRQAHSMPGVTGSEIERTEAADRQQLASLPAQLDQNARIEGSKENRDGQEEVEGFQVVGVTEADLAESQVLSSVATRLNQQQQQPQQQQQQQSISVQQPPSHLGDSLIEMIINLRNENQNLVRALEKNNDYVKERIGEFKAAQEEAKRRELQFNAQKADYEHQLRKLQRQKLVLSEKLKNMEAKLGDMRIEVGESLDAAHSSRASSVRDPQEASALYPSLPEAESFQNSALASAGPAEATTMQVDAASCELLNQDDQPTSSTSSSSESSSHSPGPTAPAMETDQPTVGARVAEMTSEQLSERFDAQKSNQAAEEDYMKQCDLLEKQLNDIGRRDYEICLLQQQLNIYRQDYRLERMAHMEAKIQIEKLKTDIERLCLERRRERDQLETEPKGHYKRGHHRAEPTRFDPAATADALMGKLGRKAAKTAAKAARYASKQAHLEEKAAARAAAAAAYSAAAKAAAAPPPDQTNSGAPPHHYVSHHHGHHHGHHRRSRVPSGLRAVKTEVVNDLLSTANKAMLTGYRMASTHVNLALDKLSQYEQQQANNLASPRATTAAAAADDDSNPRPSAPAMDQQSLHR